MRLLLSVLFLCVAFIGFGQATKLRPLSGIVKSNAGEPSDEIAIDSNTTMNGINREGFWVKNVCRKLITASSPTNSVKIKTRIPFSAAASMSNIRIFGGVYALSKNIDIVVNWYQYSGGFYSYQWESKGSFAPSEVRLCQESDGFVSVWLGGVNTFYLGLQVDVFRYQDAATKSEMKYWSIVDENYTTATTNVVVPRANLDVQDGTANNHAATVLQLNTGISNLWKIGGNNVNAASVVGTNTDYALQFKANNTVRQTIFSNATEPIFATQFEGAIRAGSAGATNGTIVLNSMYPQFLSAIGTRYSYGALMNLAGMYQNGSTTWLSGYGYSAISRIAVGYQYDGMSILTAPVQNVAFGSPLTTQPSEKFLFDANGYAYFRDYNSPTAKTNTPIASAVFDVNGRIGTAPLPIYTINHSADFTGDGATMPLALTTPYLPLTNTTNKTVDMLANTLSITGGKTSIEKAWNSATNSYTDLSSTITQRQNSARIDSTGFVTTVTKGAGASAAQGRFEMSGYPIRPTISYSDQSFKKGWILTAMDTGGKSEWMPERVYGTNRRIATLIGGSSGTTSITLTDEDIIVYTQVSGGQVLVNLPNSTAFCNREIKLVRKGALLGAQINVASTAAIIQDRNTGNYYSSDVVSGNREYLCDCSGGSPLWLYSSDN